MRISVELVPKSAEQIRADAHIVRAASPAFTALNIPDLTRFDLRSWEGCRLTKEIVAASIPHIRAIDLGERDEDDLCRFLQHHALSEVLVVRGDPPHDLTRRTYPNTSEDVIRRLKLRLPSLRVYAVFDPYRHGFYRELEGVRRKLDAGADGFFTQPIFDLRLLKVCADLLYGREVYWGISPVLGPRSRSYWETTNKIIFPREFTPTMAWNKNFAARALAAVKELGGNAYLMPLRVNLKDYLDGIV
jgi:methylenetetrahydrofolate reductase (NADPH)